MTATTMLIAAALDATSAEPDLVRYAITQGGLLAVVLVLLWSIRRDAMRLQVRDDDRIAVLAAMVEKTTTALNVAASAAEANEKALHRLARAIESQERR